MTSLLRNPPSNKRPNSFSEEEWIAEHGFDGHAHAHSTPRRSRNASNKKLKVFTAVSLEEDEGREDISMTWKGAERRYKNPIQQEKTRESFWSEGSSASEAPLKLQTPSSRAAVALEPPQLAPKAKRYQFGWNDLRLRNDALSLLDLPSLDEFGEAPFSPARMECCELSPAAISNSKLWDKHKGDGVGNIDIEFSLDSLKSSAMAAMQTQENSFSVLEDALGALRLKHFSTSTPVISNVKTMNSSSSKDETKAEPQKKEHDMLNLDCILNRASFKSDSAAAMRPVAKDGVGTKQLPARRKTIHIAKAA